MPAQKSPVIPHRAKPLKEQLQEAVNANIVQLAGSGCQGVDDLIRRGRQELERRGITGMEEISDSVADLAKKILLRGLSR